MVNFFVLYFVSKILLVKMKRKTWYYSEQEIFWLKKQIIFPVVFLTSKESKMQILKNRQM